MADLYTITKLMNEMVDQLIDDEFRSVKPKEVGLDVRTTYELFINEDYIAIRKDNRRSLDYYGGFEYVDEEHVQEFGDYVFYHAEDERVADHLAQYYQDQEDEENV
jgi:hypothetical protein